MRLDRLKYFTDRTCRRRLGKQFLNTSMATPFGLKKLNQTCIGKIIQKQRIYFYLILFLSKANYF